MKLPKRTVALIIGFFSAFLFIGYSYAKNISSKPNVILIILDAARPDHFSCYGYEKDTTPSIDAIAQGGKVFLNHFAQSTNTYGSLRQLFSSRYFSKEIFEMDGWCWGVKRTSPMSLMRDFDPEQTMLPAVLSMNGYKTAIFTQHAMHTKQTDLVKSFQVYYPIGLDQKAPFSSIVDPVADWLSNNKKNSFFMYLHLMYPHSPYPKEFEKNEFLINANGNPFTESQINNTKNKFSSTPNHIPYQEGFTEADYRCLRGLYDCNLNQADDIVGKVYAKLKKPFFPAVVLLTALKWP